VYENFSIFQNVLYFPSWSPVSKVIGYGLDDWGRDFFLSPFHPDQLCAYQASCVIGSGDLLLGVKCPEI